MVAISIAESRVMQVLWDRSPQSAEDVIKALSDTNWHEKTVKTLLNRLLGKGAIKAAREGRRYLYAPVLAREQWQEQESRSLLDRVFAGRLAPMLAHFSQHEELNEDELHALRELVEAIERNHDPDHTS